MKNVIQNLFNFVNDNLGKDSTVIGLCGLRTEAQNVFVNIPKHYKKTYIPNIERNFFLI